MEAGLPQASRLNDGLNLFWIACGKKDFLFERNEEVHAALTKAGVKHDYVVTEGDHSWPVWRRYLVDFLPLLFR
jgi:enterochelin esterase family protein